MTTSQSPVPPAAPAKTTASAWDRVLTLLVLLLALALASTPVRDSDVWRHLATGRAILLGDGGVRSDPFTYTQPHAPWLNRAWLSDVVLFKLHEAFGDGVVLLKALLAAVIAGLLIAASGPRRSVAVAAAVAAAALSLAALGPHLGLRSELLSCLFLAFTFYWLQRPSVEGGAWRQLRADVPLFIAFAIWANVDDWPLLGPTLVGLHAAFDRRRWPTFALGLACCLLNPHHIRGLAPPAVELAATWPPAGWGGFDELAFVPQAALLLLAALSAAAFALNRAKIDRPGAIAWLALLVASFWCEPAQRFFAIVAAPILAKNVAAWLADRAPAPERARRVRVALQASGALLLLALIAVALPGWLQGGHEARAWRLVADPSLQRLAERMSQPDLRLGPQDRVLPLSLEAAHHLEWFCPQTHVFLDSRRGFFTVDTARDFQDLREQFASQPALLDRWRITHLLVHDVSDRALLAALQRVWSAGWKAIALEGRAVLFVRGDLHRPGVVELDMEALALRHDTTKTAPDEAGEPKAPTSPWLAPLLPASEAGRLDEGEALACVAHFESQRSACLAKHKASWEALQVGAMAAALSPGGSVAASSTTLSLHAALLTGSQRGGSAAAMNQLAGRLIAGHLQRGDDGPPGSLFLALRAARRALHANPDDALAWLRLGQAYFRLDRHTRERAADFPLLHRLRKIQILASLQQAVRLDPDLSTAHETLVKLSLEDNRLDLALHHLRQQIRLAEAARPRSAETAEQHGARLRALHADEAALGKQVRELLNQTETLSFSFDAFAKARLAQDKGLAQRALQILLRSAYGEFGREGALLELQLLLMNGQIDDVKAWVEPAQEPVLGTSQYCWLNALLGAVAGDYARADAALMRTQSTLAGFEVPEAGLRDAPARQAVALIFAKRLLDEANLQPLAWRESAEHANQRMRSLASALRARAELSTLRGLLALEHGANAKAAGHFQDALRDGVADGALARHYLDLLQRHAPR